ncbi:hypothetical protein E2542_SST15533 [Spatholobus suberectus]|nr:hypothetical protein E2542_SST15533 [Spatholobus suberectus]
MTPFFYLVGQAKITKEKEWASKKSGESDSLASNKPSTASKTTQASSMAAIPLVHIMAVTHKTRSHNSCKSPRPLSPADFAREDSGEVQIISCFMQWDPGGIEFYFLQLYVVHLEDKVNV